MTIKMKQPKQKGMNETHSNSKLMYFHTFVINHIIFFSIYTFKLLLFNRVQIAMEGGERGGTSTPTFLIHLPAPGHIYQFVYDKAFQYQSIYIVKRE